MKVEQLGRAVQNAEQPDFLVRAALSIAAPVIKKLISELPWYKRIWVTVKALLGVIDDYLYGEYSDGDE